MSTRFRPVGQVRLTNVAVVRLKRGGKRFEIACYKNKVVNWRNGVETDIDEVLQTDSVFSNVSKGVSAKEEDLMKCFKTTDLLAICKMILDKGDLQISDKERKVQFENLYRDVATIIAEKCINPTNGRPYPVSVIETAMKDIHIALAPSKAAKQQALEVIEKLKGHLPIERAKMKLRLTVPSASGKAMTSQLEGRPGVMLLGQHGMGGDHICEVLVRPGLYREMDDLVQRFGKGEGHFEVVELAVKAATAPAAADAAAKETPGSDAPTELASSRPAAPGLSGNPAFSAGATAVDTDARNADVLRRSGWSGGASAQHVLVKPTRKLQCNACGGIEFADREEHREHYRSDLHRVNLKRKMHSQSPLSAADLEAMSPDAIEAILKSD